MRQNETVTYSKYRKVNHWKYQAVTHFDYEKVNQEAAPMMPTCTVIRH